MAKMLSYGLLLTVLAFVNSCETPGLGLEAAPGAESPAPPLQTLAAAPAAVKTASARASAIGQLFGTAQIPEGLDSTATQLGIPARLINLNLVTVLETSLGPSLYLPFQISSREGGRLSTYFLSPGESVITGALVNNNKIYYREVRRDSGDGKPAKTGDRFTEIILDENYQPIRATSVTLKVLEPKTLTGQFIIAPTSDDGPWCPCWGGGSQMCSRC